MRFGKPREDHGTGAAASVREQQRKLVEAVKMLRTGIAVREERIGRLARTLHSLRKQLDSANDESARLKKENERLRSSR